MIGGTASGTGKTSVTLGLVGALKEKGFVVQTFKVGPDFLDPTYLSIASGRPCYNLDGWMMGHDYVRTLFARAVEGADIAVIEGVMGLFDGASPGRYEGSTAEIALWLDSPILLIVDAHGLAQSIAAVVKGFSTLDSRLNIGGVIANRCGSERHGIFLSETLEAAMLPPVVGLIRQGGLTELKSRHLGLVTAGEKTVPHAVIAGLAGAAGRCLSLDTIVDIARNTAPLGIGAVPRKNAQKRVRLGVALDDAFHFYYRDFFDELEDNGCALVPFSPLTDRGLPDKIDALYFGGGYPEENAEILSENRMMLTAVRIFAVSGRPIYAECGGLMYLCRGLEKKDGAFYSMVGILPATTKMDEKCQSLAYVEVTLKDNSLWGMKNDVLRGHEFHYSKIVSNPVGKDGWKSVYSMKKNHSAPTDEGYQKGRLLISYAHLCFPANEKAVCRFLENCGGKR